MAPRTLAGGLIYRRLDAESVPWAKPAWSPPQRRAGLARPIPRPRRALAQNDIHGEPRLEACVARGGDAAPLSVADALVATFLAGQGPHDAQPGSACAHLRELVEATLADGDARRLHRDRGLARRRLHPDAGGVGRTRRHRPARVRRRQLRGPAAAGRRPLSGRPRAIGLFRFDELAVSEAEVRRNFDAYGLLDDQVVFLKGFFKDTLPTADTGRGSPSSAWTATCTSPPSTR